MIIGIYAFDRGPHGMFMLIAEAAKRHGHTVLQMPAAQLMPTEEFVAKCRTADIVLINFAALQNAEVEFLKQLGGVPFVAVDDLYGSPFRPHAKVWAPRAAGVILAFDFQRERATEFGYPKGRIFHVGPPAHWKEGYLRLRDGSDERMSMKLARGGTTAPMSQNYFIVFYAGSKHPGSNNRVIEAAITSGIAEYGEHFTLSWRPRPLLDEEPPQLPPDASAEEKQKREEEVAKLEPLFAYRQKLLAQVPLVDFGKVSMQVCMLSADVSILTGGSTDSLLSSYARRPFVYWDDEDNTRHLRETGASGGTWFVAERGGGRIVKSAEELREAFREFQTPEGRRALKAKQEAAFPLPENWDTAPLVIELVENIVGGRTP